MCIRACARACVCVTLQVCLLLKAVSSPSVCVSGVKRKQPCPSVLKVNLPCANNPSEVMSRYIALTESVCVLGWMHSLAWEAVIHEINRSRHSHFQFIAMWSLLDRIAKRSPPCWMGMRAEHMNIDSGSYSCWFNLWSRLNSAVELTSQPT